MSKTSAQPKRKRPSSQASGALNDPLLLAWEKTLRGRGDQPAILDVQGKILRTFGEIEARAEDFAGELKSIAAGQVLAIQIGNHPDWPSLFLACLRKSIVVLPLELTISEQQRKTAFETCGAVAAAVALGRNVSVLPVKSAAATTWKGAVPSLLKLTSGTTAAPRAIRFRSQQLLADCENICDTKGITSADLNFGVIPISHSYGFSNLLTPLIARGVPLVLSSDRIPRAILDAIIATRATVFPGMPVFYQSLCDLGERPRLKNLRLYISAGAPLTLELANDFKTKFGREIHSFYGASECGGICYVRKPRPITGYVGEPMRGVQIEQRADGTVRVKSGAAGEGYFPDPDETKLGHGFFCPDDLLEKVGGGFRIIGRVSDLINVAGKKVNPIEIETVLLGCEGVREAIAFGRESTRRNEEVAACVVSSGGISEAQLLALCRARLSSWQVPRSIYFIETLPVNDRGKISRRELARRFPARS